MFITKQLKSLKGTERQDGGVEVHNERVVFDLNPLHETPRVNREIRSLMIHTRSHELHFFLML